MKLIITSPEHHHEAGIAWIEFNTSAGNFIIMLGHVPMIVTLSNNSVVSYMLKNGHQETIVIAAGIAHITRTDVTLLLDRKP